MTADGQPVVGETSNKVLVMSAVGAMQAAGHDRQLWYRQHRARPFGKLRAGSCKKRKDGAPRVQEREGKALGGWATRLWVLMLLLAVGPWE